MSKKHSKRIRARGSPLPVTEDYASSVARVTLEAQKELQGLLGDRVTQRRLVNYLRGNQAPPQPEPGSPAVGSGVFGLLWAEPAAWIQELIDRLVEEGYLDVRPPPQRGLLLGGAGERVLAGGELPGAEVLPRRVALGAHPETEERLRELRRRLATAEGRPPFSIFTNATLAQLASSKPKDLGELSLVPGLGERRVRKYGRKILAALRKGGGRSRSG